MPLARRGLQPTFAEDLGDLGLELERRIVRLDSVGGLRDICVDTGYTHVDLSLAKGGERERDQ